MVLYESVYYYYYYYLASFQHCFVVQSHIQNKWAIQHGKITVDEA